VEQSAAPAQSSAARKARRASDRAQLPGATTDSVDAPLPEPAAAPGATAAAPIPVPTAVPTPAPDAAPAQTSSTTSGKASPPSKPHAGPRAPSTTTHIEHASTPEALARATDSELVHRAAKALRSEHDPALAARLLEVHRARNPSGPLAEEALSLQVEALRALRSPRAVTYAREYLARYPRGRYTAVAKGALSDVAP
jgi:hypothetical protein